MRTLRWEGVSKYWPAPGGEGVPAVLDVDLAVNAGEFVALIGPSGCGKTTLLEIAAGLESPTSGCVTLDGKAIDGPGPDRTLVFQEHHLFPWLRVRSNVAFGLRFAGLSRSDRKKRVDGLLSAVGLAGVADKLPPQLSGGMRQRVALARALAVGPEVLLLDEPFAALDFQTRILMQRYLLAVWQRFGTTMVFVTHQVDEALLLADRVALVSAGPGRLLEEIAIDLPRPRDPADPRFLKLRAQLTSHLEREVMAAADEGMGELLLPAEESEHGIEAHERVF
ncbi:ABC transporter ATP-binding protein [Amycolatopsis sp. GM8]|uniref:ABC transporter ATP-binding protein n=1 Tax=Amycolatopsis sp. GM8 TaxID=2896530 RepID=UPI001F2F7C20|nr:ABC transporter ATP-binding protein [Amycolatopsis sp. GM8]